MNNTKLLKLNKELCKEHKGVIAIEAMIQTPLMFMTFLILIYIFFMGLSYIAYNNIANNIAQDLNMRQTGYRTAVLTNPTMPLVWSYRTTTTNNSIDSGKYLNAGDVITEPSSIYLRSGVYSSLEKHADGLVVPFTEVTNIKVVTSKTIDPLLGNKMAGTVITVNIRYKSFMGSFGDINFSLPTLNAVGYNIIS